MEGEKFEARVEERRGFCYIVPNGDINIGSLVRFKRVLSEQIAQGYQNILIDMSNVEYMDSSGFGTLVSALKQLRPSLGTVALAHCNATVSRSLRITRLDSVIRIFPNVDIAIDALHRNKPIQTANGSHKRNSHLMIH